MSPIGLHENVSKQYAEYYKDGASEWRRLGAFDKAANIVGLCDQLPLQSVLEIGAGDGSILSRLSELGFGQALYAVEISPSGVEVINQRHIPRLVECVLFDGYHLPYADRRFDLAILSHVIEHVEHPRQLLYEAARVARYVFVEVPTEDISRRPKDYSDDSVGHINFFSPRTIRWLVQSCGLRVLRQITTNPSRATYVYEAGRSGLARYQLKQLLLRWLPGFATRHFCYHEALLATGVGVKSDHGLPIASDALR
jgi:ubiquinone/menaquinone biosynthesis C-methylase UbiE